MFRKERIEPAQLIKLGGLVSKAQLENWNVNALLGGFLSLKERENDSNQMNAWIHKGGVAFSGENGQIKEKIDG